MLHVVLERLLANHFFFYYLLRNSFLIILNDGSLCIMYLYSIVYALEKYEAL